MKLGMKLGLRAPGKLTVTDPATDMEASGLEGRLLSYNVSTQNATSPPHVVQIHRQSCLTVLATIQHVPPRASTLTIKRGARLQ